MAGYPFDRELLSRSRLYRVSREIYLKQGGTFVPALVSNSRSLSSAALLENYIEYTPAEAELEWALTDRLERRRHGSRGQVLRYMSSLYHEQNHRLLWRLLPRPPQSAAALRRYLNLAESLVIVADMALGDELGPRVAKALRDANVVYDPGTTVRKAASHSRVYRNYLQACLYATYLALEGYEPRVVAEVVTALYEAFMTPALLRRALDRALRLNPGFIRDTNLVWQRKHRAKVATRLGRGTGPRLELDAHPLNNVAQYRLGEAWFDRLGL